MDYPLQENLQFLTKKMQILRLLEIDVFVV